MPTDYENVYQQQRHALGSPTQEFVAFFDQYEKKNASVLDVGCGQGRDALFIARLGHHVVGVDRSTTGISQLVEDAQSEKLEITGVVADLQTYQPEGHFDVVVIDRTLHMLSANAQLDVLERVCHATHPNAYVLIADEKSNLPRMRTFFEDDGAEWETIKDQKGFLFVKKI